jgi:hypothetical protein
MDEKTHRTSRRRPLAPWRGRAPVLPRGQYAWSPPDLQPQRKVGCHQKACSQANPASHPHRGTTAVRRVVSFLSRATGALMRSTSTQ